jgi:hypothetical protein
VKEIKVFKNTKNKGLKKTEKINLQKVSTPKA